MSQKAARITLSSPDQTAALALRLGARLGPGDTLLLEGPIGAGKTHFARSLIQSRLATPEDVPSPTFTLVQSYEADGVEIWHADLYRLTSPDEVVELGLTDAFQTAICLVEWPDRLGSLTPQDALTLSFAQGKAEDTRELTLSWTAPEWAARLFGVWMTDRSALADKFVASTDWAGATRKPLAGDASNRRYERLHLDKKTAVLMDAPRDKGEDIRPFIRISRFLSGLGLSAPAIMAEDVEHGFLLLEDLGDDLFAKVISRQLELERPLYEAATDALIHLHRAAPPDDLKPYDPAAMLDMAALAWRWYLGAGLAENTASEQAFRAAFAPILQAQTSATPVLIQRDYHAENLLWLPDRNGPARVGLLDFQDAMKGHPAYDLVSVLQDARRDVPPAIEEAMITRYITATGHDNTAFRAAYAVLGAQRNLRILGVFGRLCLMNGKPHYVDLIPRVWDLMLRDLAHPALSPVAGLITDALPEPTPDILKRLKDKCATIPKP